MKPWDQNNPRSKILERTRKLILDAAREEFLANGFGATTMIGVAHRAGVSSATLYRHAATKEALFAEVVRLSEDSQEIEQSLSQMRKMDLEALLAFYAGAVLDVLARPEILGLQRLVIAEADRFPQLGSALFEAHHGHFAEALARLLGERSVPNPELTAREFVSDVIGDYQIRLLMGATPLTRKERDRRIDRVVRGHFAQMARPAEPRRD